MIVTTGKELADFLSDDDYWPEGAYHADEEIWVDGESVPEGEVDLSDLPLESSVKIRGGTVYVDGLSDVRDLEDFFGHWRVKQNIAVFLVECPRELCESVTRAVRDAGGTVVGEED